MIITGLKLVIPIETEPITVSDIKGELKLDTSDTSEDTLIQSYISIARQECEDITGIATAPQTWELILDKFPCSGEIDLEKWPVTSVASFKYYDLNNVEYQFTDYITKIDADYETGKLILKPYKCWPSTGLWPADPIRIRFTAGITSNFPANLKKAIVSHACILYKFREELPDSVKDSIKKNYKFFKITSWF